MRRRHAELAIDALGIRVGLFDVEPELRDVTFGSGRRVNIAVQLSEDAAAAILWKNIDRLNPPVVA